MTPAETAIAELWTEDDILYAPPGMIAGQQAIGRFAGELRSTHPDFVQGRAQRTIS